MLMPRVGLGFDIHPFTDDPPRLAPHRAAMESRLAEVVGAPVGVKPKRAETLGALGRHEGVACLAVAVVAAR